MSTFPRSPTAKTITYLNLCSIRTDNACMEPNVLRNVCRFRRDRIIFLIGMILLVWGIMAPMTWGQQVLMPLSGTQGAEDINNGVNHFYQHNWNSAVTQFREALKKNPNSDVAHYNLALALRQMGRHTQATEHFQKASKFGSTNLFIQNSSEVKQALSQNTQ